LHDLPSDSQNLEHDSCGSETYKRYCWESSASSTQLIGVDPPTPLLVVVLTPTPLLVVVLSVYPGTHRQPLSLRVPSLEVDANGHGEHPAALLGSP
jgi:hypothetical protein